MKRIYLNLKRFDVPVEQGGVNRLAPIRTWGQEVICQTAETAKQWEHLAEFVHFFPEAHLIPALETAEETPIQIGTQSIYREDVSVGGNFGAFTSVFPAASAAALGCTCVLIGHCEERRDKLRLVEAAGTSSDSVRAVQHILNQEVHAAQKAGLSVLYCVGEADGEQGSYQEVLQFQLQEGLRGVDLSRVTVAYEPIWAIGPGKIPPDIPYIQKIVRWIRSCVETPIVYGGGLKVENAEMLARIPELDGGLIALTRFGDGFGFYPEEYAQIVNLYLSNAF